MSDSPEEGLRKNSTPVVVPNTPDFCKTPIGSSTPPLPYFPIGYFTDAEGVTQTVHFTGNEVFTSKSHIPAVVGNEPGTAGGVKSGVNCGTCVAKTMSSTVRVEGGWLIKHNSIFEMNCPSPSGGGNLEGKAIYVESQAMAYITEDGEIKEFKHEQARAHVTEEGEIKEFAHNRYNYQSSEGVDVPTEGPTFQPLPPWDGQTTDLPTEGAFPPLENHTADLTMTGPSAEEISSAQADVTAAEAELAAAQAEIDRVNYEMKLDATQAALGFTGLVDPTPISDLSNAAISFGRGNYFDAFLDGVSAFPYIGDAVAKPVKAVRMSKKAVKMAKALEKAKEAAKIVAEKLKKAKQKLEDLVKKKKIDKDKGPGDGGRISQKPKIKKPARRHDPCKTKGKDRTKDKNSMVDPDTDISDDLKALESGDFTRKGEDYVVGGRTYGVEESGTVYPKSGPGIVKVDRAQHQLLKRLNSASYDDAMKFAKNMPGLDQKKVSEVLKLWKKCK